jgi:hypothetical protein
MALLPRIRDLDCLLRQNSDLLNTVFEVHPEVCFHYWNNRRPMRYSKHSGFGFMERFQLVEQSYRGAVRKSGNPYNPKMHPTTIFLTRSQPCGPLIEFIPAMRSVFQPNKKRTSADFRCRCGRSVLNGDFTACPLPRGFNHGISLGRIGANQWLIFFTAVCRKFFKITVDSDKAKVKLPCQRWNLTRGTWA